MESRGITAGVSSLKRATREAIEAAGGLDSAEKDTRAGRSQLSRCQSQNDDDTLSLRDALALDEITLARGGPFILKALAKRLNHAVVELPDFSGDGTGLAESVMTLAAELGDVSRKISKVLADGKVSPAEAQAVLDELYEHDQASAALRLRLEAIARPGSGKIDARRIKGSGA
jgi:hypothetical protein